MYLLPAKPIALPVAMSTVCDRAGPSPRTTVCAWPPSSSEVSRQSLPISPCRCSIEAFRSAIVRLR